VNDLGEYEDTLKDIEETLGIVPGFMKALPKDVLIHDYPLWKKYSLGESKIPAKYRELMGLSAAANIKCPYCQLMHRGVAQLHGATDEELSEAAYLASLTARWSAMIHAQHYDYDTFARETDQIGKHLAKTLKKK
jgi:AhpD family alkylhydroperoxidase